MCRSYNNDYDSGNDNDDNNDIKGFSEFAHKNL